MTLKGWYECAELQAKLRLLLEPLDSDDDEPDKRAQARQELTVEARMQLEPLQRNGVPEAVYGLHSLLCRIDLPASADHDDAMHVFYQSALFDRQSPAVRQRSTDELEQHMLLADESEMPDVRTILEAALPGSVREWLRLVRQQHLGPELGTLLEEIRSQMVTDEVIEQRINQFKRRIGLEALLPSCGSCGIRDDYKKLEFIQGRVSASSCFQQPSARGAARQESRDLLTDRDPPKSSYLKVHLQNVVLKTLRLSLAQEAELWANSAAAYTCVFEDVQPVCQAPSTICILAWWTPVRCRLQRALADAALAAAELAAAVLAAPALAAGGGRRGRACR
jgi:hypothetical protein